VIAGLSDEPRWVEAHGIASDATSWRRDGIVGSDRAKLVVAFGDVDLEELAREFPAHTLLATRAIAGRISERAILHTLPEPDALPDYDGAVILGDVSQVPSPLADELRGQRVFAAFVDGAPVSFAYTPWRSTRWFDVSVDTLPGARQLGLGTLVTAAMIRDERAHGREPVWGANESNHASLRLAQRLGFVAMDEIWVSPPQ
jgi:GNAT superfamily N-acetyltransferase